MNLLGVECYGVAGVPNGAYSLSDAAGQALDFVAVVGPPASGKTRLLEVIAAAKETIAPYGRAPHVPPWIRAGGVASKVVLTWSLDDEEQRFSGCDAAVTVEVIFSVPAPPPEIEDGMVALLCRYAERFGAPSLFGVPGKLEYFPANREIPVAWRSLGLDHRGLRLTRDRSKYAFVPRQLEELPDDALLESLLAVFAPTCGFDSAAARRKEPCFVSRTGEARRLFQLAGNEADGVLVAATAAMLGLDRSVVLVDKPELAASAGSAARLLDGWRRVGRGTQVIAATSWTELVDLLPAERVLRM